VRGDAALTARLLLRGTGLAGLLAAGGGALAIGAATRPWYRVVATVEMLGATDQRSAAVLAGLPGTTIGWLTAVAGTLAVALGLLIAVDRPPHWARPGLIVVALALVVLVALAHGRVPDVDVVAGERSAQLAELAQRMPSGVQLTLTTEPATGLRWVAGAAAAILLGGAAARDA
jgi:hypothetical protein